MAKFQIACPIHQKREQIDIPDNAETGFHEVACGNATDSQKVRARLFVSGDIKSIINVEPASKKHAPPSYGQF